MRLSIHRFTAACALAAVAACDATDPLAPAPKSNRLHVPAVHADGQPGASAIVVAPESPSLIWNRSNGDVNILRMNGATWTGQTAVPLNLPAPWRLAATADLNKDGHPDLLWENTADGHRRVTFMSGPNYSGHFRDLGTVSLSTRLAAGQDMNGDGNPDLIWSNDSTGEHSVWYMNGSTYTGNSAALLNLGPTWKLVAVADMNGNSSADLIWEQRTTGLRAVTFMSGSAYSGEFAVFASVDSSWHIVAAADFNADSKTDLVWSNSGNGYSVVTYMNGAIWNGQLASLAVVAPTERLVAASPVQWVQRTAFFRLITFGDSNTDLGILGVDPNYKATSYVSNAPEPPDSRRLGPTDPNHPLQLAGKFESRWRTARSEVIKVVNHGVVASTTGTGRTFRSSPNALEVVNGFTRFEGEVLGRGYPWSGGETYAAAFPSGPVLRVQAFTPSSADFVYVSIGINDLPELTVTQILANLDTMVRMWTSAGLPANHFIITTLPPREPEKSVLLPSLNAGIRTLAASRGLRLIDLASFTSADDGKTWIRENLHVTGNPLHFSEEVRDWAADRLMEILNPIP